MTIDEVVADKPYHSNQILVDLELTCRLPITLPALSARTLQARP